MAVYPASNSALVIEPQNVTPDDIALFTMESNPMDALRYFISISDDSPKFQSNIYEKKIENISESFVSDKELEDADGAVFAKYSQNNGSVEFFFFNLLKNTAWASNLLNVSNETIVSYVEKGKINGIRSSNKKYMLIIPDEKFHNFLKERSNMSTHAPAPAAAAVSKQSLHDKVLAIIKTGVVGGRGESFTATDLLPHLAASYPDINWTRTNVNNALGTNLSHGDLVRVPILDRSGNPTKSFARGKFRINFSAAVNHPVPVVLPPVVNHPVVQHPQMAALNSPPPVKSSNPLESNQRATLKLPERVAIESHIAKYMDITKNGYLVFSIDDILSEHPHLNRKKIAQSVNNAKRGESLKDLFHAIKPGVWAYRKNTNIPWERVLRHEVQPVAKTVSEINGPKLDVDKIAAELLKQGIPLSKVVEMVGKL